MTAALIVKIRDIKELLARGRIDPGAAFPEIRALAASDRWQTREVAATTLVEIGKRHATAVLRQARLWAKDKDPNVRRAAAVVIRARQTPRPRVERSP